MSGSVLPLLTGIGAIPVDIAVSVLFRPPRAIGLLLPSVVVEETASDQLAITKHPVQMGAMISDHAYKEPATITIKGAWSGSSYGALLGLFTGDDILGTLTDGILGDSYVQQVYQQLYALQISREPFEVITGKRVYQDMLISSLMVHTDKNSEYILDFMVTCQQVLIVNTTTAALPPTALQRNPASTASPAPTGQVAPQALPGPSGLRALGGLSGLFQ